MDGPSFWPFRNRQNGGRGTAEKRRDVPKRKKFTAIGPYLAFFDVGELVEFLSCWC